MIIDDFIRLLGSSLIVFIIGYLVCNNMMYEISYVEKCKALPGCEKYDCLIDGNKNPLGVHQINNLLLEKQNCLLEEIKNDKS